MSPQRACESARLPAASPHHVLPVLLGQCQLTGEVAGERRSFSLHVLLQALLHLFWNIENTTVSLSVNYLLKAMI